MAAKKLESYRKKRDFKITSEPSGARAVKPAKQLRFVIQRHAATRLHYDLRLELDGVFKSWAVTKGPSLDPKDKRLAVEVEDHPLDYGDFEGTIPKGQYGGGTVMLWDRGFWAPLEGLDAQKALKKGELKFAVEGERLHGEFVLVRLKRREGEKRDNWLLIKHRDDYARDGGDITSDDESIASGRSMAQITAGKGATPEPFMLAKASAADAVWQSNRSDDKAPSARAKALAKKAAAPKSASPKRTVRAVLRKLPDFIEPQLCRSVDRAPDGAEWAHEIKLDGYRMQLRVAGGKVQLFTRKGLDWTAKFKEIAAAGAGLPEDAILDGEICAVGADNAPDFPALQAAISDGKTGNLIYFVFDLLCIGSEDLRALPLATRKARLKTLLTDVSPRLRYVDHFTAAGDAVLKAACRMSLEGIVSKRLDAPYKSGRNDNWTKAKCRGGQEVVIGGWTEETGRFRSLLVGAHHEGALVYLGRVGTGYGADVVKRIQPKLRKLAS